MKTRCPVCGTTNSLDALMAHQDASGALATAFKLNGRLGRALVMYLGLFRSATRELSFDRVSTLLNEILPDIDRKQITRSRVDHPAPAEVWISAIEAVIKARDDGRLTLPFKDHGYLYAVISQTKALPAQQPATPTSVQTKRKAALNGVAPEDMLAHLLQHKQGYESTDETYERLLQEQNQ